MRLNPHHSRLKILAVLLIVRLASMVHAADISVRLEGTNPAIDISHLSGERLVFQASSPEESSIGYQKSGKTIWIKGEPVITVSKLERIYTWDMPEEKVVLTIRKAQNDLDFQFCLRSPDGSQAEKWMICLKALPGEYFTGLFERVIDGPQDCSWAKGIQTALNLRGETVEMKLRPTVSAYAPFYISSNNYGLFIKGTWPGRFDFCQSDSDFVRIEFEGPTIAFRLYRGKLPADIVKRHALETGPSVLPPKWAFGPWRWRDNHVNRDTYYDGTEVHAPFNSELVEDILMMQAYDIPCTAYWIDRPWGTGVRGFDDYQFDPERFPNADTMIPWINKKGIEMMIWIAPFVMGEMAHIAEERGYFLKSNIWKNSRQVLMDFTHPEACEWWGENGPGKLARMGIRGFKLDRADGEKLLDSLHLTTFDGTSYRENYNDYPVQYVRAAYRSVQPVLGDNFVLFPRAQYTGSSRYGAMWSGDPRGTPEGLRSVIIALQRCSVMGYPIWGSDIGGYGRMFNRETCLRWLGFGCFSPIMENGPTVDRGFWNSPDKPDYDIELIATWRLYTHLRMKLIDYIHDLATGAHETGMPVVRPLFLVYPEQTEAWEDWQTYLLGPDLLVSVIWQKGKTRHRLYLPSGEIWIDAWNPDKIYQGGKSIEVQAPLYMIPVFIRRGANLHLGDLKKLYSESLQIAEKRPDLAELERAEGWRDSQ